jgi:hypothetical protein
LLPNRHIGRCGPKDHLPDFTVGKVLGLPPVFRPGLGELKHDTSFKVEELARGSRACKRTIVEKAFEKWAKISSYERATAD